MNLRVKGENILYKTVVRPAIVYAYRAGTWVVTKVQEKKLDVVEVRVLRWRCGVTKLDRIWNERIIVTTKVGDISKKMLESMLKWCEHIMRGMCE